MRLAWALCFFLVGQVWAAEPTPSYTDTNSVTALRHLEKFAGRDAAKLSEAEGVEWVRARFAWIALLRLEGKEKEALQVFSGCGKHCKKWGAAPEWVALQRWACARSANLSPCKK